MLIGIVHDRSENFQWHIVCSCVWYISFYLLACWYSFFFWNKSRTKTWTASGPPNKQPVPSRGRGNAMILSVPARIFQAESDSESQHVICCCPYFRAFGKWKRSNSTVKSAWLGRIILGVQTSTTGVSVAASYILTILYLKKNILTIGSFVRCHTTMWWSSYWPYGKWWLHINARSIARQAFHNFTPLIDAVCVMHRCPPPPDSCWSTVRSFILCHCKRTGNGRLPVGKGLCAWCNFFIYFLLRWINFFHLFFCQGRLDTAIY